MTIKFQIAEKNISSVCLFMPFAAGAERCQFLLGFYLSPESRVERGTFRLTANVAVRFHMKPMVDQCSFSCPSVST
jgi:hypothetical protein